MIVSYLVSLSRRCILLCTRPERKTRTHLPDGIRNLFTDQRQEPGVQTRKPFFGAELGESGGEARGVLSNCKGKEFMFDVDIDIDLSINFGRKPDQA